MDFSFSELKQHCYILDIYSMLQYILVQLVVANLVLICCLYVTTIQTTRPCESAPGSRGSSEQSTFPKRLVPITTILVSTSWMTQMELESAALNLSTDKTLSESTQRSSESGLLGGGRNQWPGKHWLRCYVILNLVLLQVRLKLLNWS